MIQTNLLTLIWNIVDLILYLRVVRTLSSLNACEDLTTASLRKRPCTSCST